MKDKRLGLWVVVVVVAFVVVAWRFGGATVERYDGRDEGMVPWVEVVEQGERLGEIATSVGDRVDGRVRLAGDGSGQNAHSKDGSATTGRSGSGISSIQTITADENVTHGLVNGDESRNEMADTLWAASKPVSQSWSASPTRFIGYPALGGWAFDKGGRASSRNAIAPWTSASANPTAQRRPRPQFADLGFSLRGTGEFGGRWESFRPCDDVVQVTCEIPLVPQIIPDIQFAATVGGTLTDRVLVDVDYDQSREFAGANRINIHYQGQPGEFLQRLDVGDVNFSLPSSHFMREAIPVGNFGFQAALKAGPVNIESVWAQQNGEVTSRRFQLEGQGRNLARTDTLVLDDADYVDGQFFFLFDPAAFFAYPHLDVLALSASDADFTVIPGVEPIQLYRSEVNLFAQQQVEGYIQADAVAGSGAEITTESAWFRYLRPGQDYVVHPSGLWIALRSPMGRDDMLAVTYVTASGDTVGTYNPEQVYKAGGRPRLRLLKASSAQHQPGRPTWRTEMHQVYRVSSSNDVAPGSVELTISLGEKSAGRTFVRGASGDDLTYLRLFGLDEESPSDRLDESQIYRPALDSFDDQPPVSGTFIVFPTLEPFAEPPLLRGRSPDPEEVRRLLGTNRNERIYRDVDPFARESGGVFRLNLSYEVHQEGVLSSLALGAVGIRERTERVTLGDRQLVRDVDYLIDYDVGELTLTNPDDLLAANPGETLEVSWEQRSLFQVAPTSVFGLNARYDLGDYGGVNLIGLYQTEDELVRRPQLGVESGAVGLGGINGSLSVEAPLLTRLLDAVPGLNAGGGSTFRLTGESTISFPNPNTQGSVYLDDFDGVDARLLSVRGQDWRRGSRPAFRDGAEELFPPELSVETVAEMTWQHQWIVEDTGGDSLGVFKGFNPATEIDQQIRVTGSAVRESGLAVRFRPPSGDVEGAGTWSSFTTVLSPTGSDLTKSDFIEFYVRDGDFLNLVLDVGIVSEDAFFADTTGAVNGVKAGTGVGWGLGTLDQEANPRLGEVWGKVADGRGVWGEKCFAERGRIYRLGDRNANCTRGNGRPDSEDMDEDGNLDTLERYRRFVVPLNGSSPFLARDRHETGTSFRLYRIPLRDPTALDVGGTITDAELRAVRHLRFTVTGRRADSFVLARLRIVGSTWIKRSLNGVLEGLGGDTAAIQGRVEVTSVSKLTEGDIYVSPPNVIEELDDPSAAFGGQGIEFNERSLSLSFEGIGPGQRAEVYNRFPQRPRDFLSYREARLWAVATRGDFGPEEPTYFFLKIGTDDSNFYLYRTRLNPAVSGRALQEEDWLPQVVIEFERWIGLRQVVEEQLIVEPRMEGDPPLVAWSVDSAYAVVVQDRGRAPNLASVREISMGVMNESGRQLSGELWVDELRLSKGIRDAGTASAFHAELNGGEFLHSRLAYRNRGGFFRQIQGVPTFQNDRSLSLHTTLQLARFAPSSWGLEAPLSVVHERESVAPIFLSQSDVRADRLEGLRNPGFDRTRVDLSLRRPSSEDGGVWERVIGGLDLRAGVGRSMFRTITTESDGAGLDAFAGYGLALPAREVSLFPGRVGSLVRALLPSFLEERVAGTKLRWTPESFRFETEFLGRELDTRRFDKVVRRATDSAVVARQAPRRLLTTTARLVLRPLESLSASADVLSGRDLLAVEELSTNPLVQALLRSERRTVAGADLGWELDRHLRTRVAYRPQLADWLQAGVVMSTLYLSERNSDLIASYATARDSVFTLLRNVDGQRNLTVDFSLNPGQFSYGGEDRFLAWWLQALEPLSLTYSNGITSRFNRDAVEPGFGYELGWGGRESFLTIGADSASTLSERGRVNLRGGIRLSGSTVINLGYDRSLNQTLDTRSDRETLRRVWPDLRGTVADLVLPEPVAMVLERISLSSGYRQETRALEFGARTRQDRFREDHQVPMTLTLGFTKGFRLSYRGRLTWGQSSDPTGETTREAGMHTLTASASLPAPLEVFRREGAPLRLMLEMGYADELQCRVATAESPCVSFVDQLERMASLSVDSAVRDFQLGVRLRYLDRRSFVGGQAGLTRFTLNFFGQFVLTEAIFTRSS